MTIANPLGLVTKTISQEFSRIAYYEIYSLKFTVLTVKEYMC